MSREVTNPLSVRALTQFDLSTAPLDNWEESHAQQLARPSNCTHVHDTWNCLVILAKKCFIILTKQLVPNQAHVLNESQIIMGFSHFHEFGILSGVYILAPHKIDIVKGYDFCNGSIILI